MIHMIFYAPYPQIVPLIKQVFQERPDCDELEYEIVQDFYNNPLQDLNADVVIARGFSALTMKQRGYICAELKVGGYDVIAAVLKARRMSPGLSHIAVIGAFNMIYGIESIRDAFPDMKLSTYPVNSEPLLADAIRQAISDGCDALVGNYTGVELAKKSGLPAVMIESGQEAINNAIDEAKSAAEIDLREKMRSAQMANIMNYSFQGILSTDQNGIITFANKYCYSILDSGHALLTGRSILDFFPNLPVEEVTRNGKKLLSELHIYASYHLMVNCVPAPDNSGNTGCVLTFQDTSRIQADELQVRKKLRHSSFQAKYQFSNILHKSRIMDSVISDAMTYSYSDSNILICGETGTGKELFAQSIHNSSPRKNHPFVAINCSALPENLLESELFGYVEGAFTGASKGGKMGFFELAHKGTIFLDEIGDVSPNLQSRLLRVLQEREVVRLGSDTVIPVDVRVISATNKNLKEEVANGRFRQDLLYRLDVLELNLPPLRNREQDALFLLSQLISYEHERTGCILTGLSEEGASLITQYPWPGNIREMRNFCQRLSILTPNPLATPADILKVLPDAAAALTPNGPKKTDRSTPGDAPVYSLYDEREEILKALYTFHNSRTKTAEFLGIDKSTLWRKMKKYHILLP
ncbi:sigma 54-interacting transcriptional regulator [Clostridium sp. AM42-4]|uniref:sigma 54-interacting transcriptional regulator n=1 Tax=Clostridium sp. AM42-4 TaxID=2292305 RepID=UPI000E51563E|nr:sigma 54-interacting transcriptional regulator [Clostridium sp. AM42-4]RHS84816.1 AAA family ATPase [Clostridium sp. AM42-4]